jgi:hypothetical protein
MKVVQPNITCAPRRANCVTMLFPSPLVPPTRRYQYLSQKIIKEKINKIEPVTIPVFPVKLGDASIISTPHLRLYTTCFNTEFCFARKLISHLNLQEEMAKVKAVVQIDGVTQEFGGSPTSMVTGMWNNKNGY